MNLDELSVEVQFKDEPVRLPPSAQITHPIDWSLGGAAFARAIGVPPDRIQRDLDERALVNALKRRHTRNWLQVLWAQIRGEA